VSLLEEAFLLTNEMQQLQKKTPEKKQLSEMTIEELWRLFPIYLTEHNSSWMNWYAEELCTLKQILPMNRIRRIAHIGSTAVHTIWAKPIIDILIEAQNTDLNRISKILTGNGYLCMSVGREKISLNKGYTINGFAERVFHLHVRNIGDHDELYFRDYLLDHSEIAKNYEAIKLKLWKKYEYDRDAYTEEKTVFVKKYTDQAKIEYKGRYE